MTLKIRNVQIYKCYKLLTHQSDIDLAEGIWMFMRLRRGMEFDKMFDEEEIYLCGECLHSWDVLGEFCCNKHGNQECPYPCKECKDFEQIDPESEL